MDNTKTKPKILKFARTEHRTKNTFWLFEIDSQIKTALIFATAKTTYAKILQEGREQLWMEYFDEVKNNMAKFEIVFYLYFLHFSRVKFIIIWSIL